MSDMGYVYKRRLLALVAFLESLPPERFDYNHWADKVARGKPACGTTACALGWAASMPNFRRLGLRLRLDDPSNPMGPNEPLDTVTGHTSYRASMRIFGLTGDEAAFLFIPSAPNNTGYPDLGRAVSWSPRVRISPIVNATAKEVADHIRAFVAAKYPDTSSRKKRNTSSQSSESSL